MAGLSDVMTGDDVDRFVAEHRPGNPPSMKWHDEKKPGDEFTPELCRQLVSADVWHALKWVSNMLGIPEGQDDHGWLLDAVGAAAFAFRKQFGTSPADATEGLDFRGMIDADDLES